MRLMKATTYYEEPSNGWVLVTKRWIVEGYKGCEWVKPSIDASNDFGLSYAFLFSAGALRLGVTPRLPEKSV